MTSHRNIMIRDYSSSDLESVVALWHEAKRRAFPYVAVQQAYTLADDHDYFVQVLLTECSVLVARQAQDIVGFIALKPGYIDQLFVRFGCQQQGIGSILLAKAKELTVADLRLYTFQKNYQARAFYEQHGFQAIAFGMSPPPENEPDVEYWWQKSEQKS